MVGFSRTIACLNRHASQSGSISPPLHAVGGAFEPDTPPVEQMVVEDVDAQVEGAIRSGKLAGKSMWSAIWILALPVLIQQLMAACVGLVDKILAGNLPEQIVVPALDAISI